MAAETLLLSSREETLTNRFVEQVLTDAYGQIGINVEFVNYPSARSVLEADLGRADGEVARLESVLEQYPNLRKVPVPIFYSELSVFMHKDYKIDISGWSSLDGHAVTAIRGFKFVEEKLSNNSPRIAKSSLIAIELIENNFSEIAVLNRFLGEVAIAKNNATNVVVVDPPLERLPVFHLLHKKHETLIPKLTSVLEGMKIDGTLRMMWEKFKTDELIKASK